MMQRTTIAMSDAEIAEFMSQSRTAVLASSSPSGFPHLVAMWYFPQGTDIAMWTYATSQKAANLRRDGRASLLIEAGDTYDTLRGVAIDASVELIDDPQAVAELGARLNARYTGSAPYRSGDEIPPDILRQASKRVGLVLHPVRYRSWDHSKLTAKVAAQ